MGEDIWNSNSIIPSFNWSSTKPKDTTHFWQWGQPQPQTSTPAPTAQVVTPTVSTPVVSTPKATVSTPPSLMERYTKAINNGYNGTLSNFQDYERYQQSLGDPTKRQANLDAYRQQSKANAESGFWSNFGNNILDYAKNNPLDAMNTLATSTMGLWNAYQGYKNNQATYDLNREYYNMAKAQYEANEARNKEAFNWQRQNRMSSSL